VQFVAVCDCVVQFVAVCDFVVHFVAVCDCVVQFVAVCDCVVYNMVAIHRCAAWALEVCIFAIYKIVVTAKYVGARSAASHLPKCRRYCSHLVSLIWCDKLRLRCEIAWKCVTRLLIS
jgi:hypothetical protein